MEPFFIFCLALVLYCGYLTVSDLLRDMRVVPAAAVEHADGKIRKKVAVRRKAQATRTPSRGYRPHRPCCGTATM